MRPPVLPSGNYLKMQYRRDRDGWASMRPPVLPSGNRVLANGRDVHAVAASMRPPVLPNGNLGFCLRLACFLGSLQ